MSDRPCDVCKRPLWNGGHALNDRECEAPGGRVCLVAAALARRERHYSNALTWIEQNVPGGIALVARALSEAPHE